MSAPAADLAPVIPIGARRARKMLDDMQTNPFVTFVFTPGGQKVYFASMSPEQRTVLADMLRDVLDSDVL